jgi:hypothetical protein
MQQNACYTRENVVPIQALNRTKVQGMATMNNEEITEIVGSNPTATTILFLSGMGAAAFACSLPPRFLKASPLWAEISSVLHRHE